MTLLNAYSNTDTGSITLDITQTADVTSIVRSNVNGSSEVRLATDQLPSPADIQIARTNLVPNPSFETNLTGYSASRNETILTRVSGGLFGSYAAKVTTTSTFGNNNIFGITLNLTLTAGKTYVFSYYRTVGTGRLDNDSRDLFYASGELKYSEVLPMEDLDNGWIRKGLRFTVPGTGAVAIQLTVGAAYEPVTNESTPIGSNITFDAFMVEESPVTAFYFDGSNTDQPQMEYAWTGAANASTSTLTTYGGRLILTDYEASQGVNTYNVYSSDGSFVSTTVELEIDKPWLVVPIAPNYSEQVELITNISAGRSTQSTVHAIMGRSDPLVVLGKQGTRLGTLEIWAKNYEDTLRITRVFDRGEVVLLKQPVAGMDMYFAATGITVDPYAVEGPDKTLYRVGIQYQEVTRPYGNLAGALGWTFDALAFDYPSFDSVLSSFSSFDDLTLGDA